jgi:membrane fusion protein (multidrug efflux system)
MGALCAIVMLTSACSDGDKDGGRQRGAPEVGFVTVKQEAVALSSELGGRTVAFQTSEVRPQVTGLIRQRLFNEGSTVRAGQPLYQIDPSLYQASVQQAQANLASAQARANASDEKVRRLKPLAAMQAVAEQDYTDAVADAGIARAAIAQARAALETARINLRFATITAPISGRIGRSIATPGALVSATQGDPLAVIQQLDPIYVDIQQSSAEMTRLRQALASGGVTAADAKVKLKLEDGSIYGPTGTVQFSDVTVNEGTGTVVLRARFPNPNGLLLPGMFVTALFDQAISPNAILVPQQAVLRDFDGTAYVMLANKDNKAVRRKITVDRSEKGFWVVTSGLKVGERVITQGLNNLKHDAPIKPVPADSPQRIGPPAPPAKKAA